MLKLIENVVNYLPSHINKLMLFPVWYWVYSLQFWYKFSSRMMIIFYDMFGLDTVLSHIFAPYRRDRTFAGYFVGIVIRLFWIVTTSLFLALGFLMISALFFSFYFAPIIIWIKLHPIYVIPYFLVWLVIYVYYLIRQDYWDKIKQGRLTTKLAYQVLHRLELNPKEAYPIFYSSKEEFIKYLQRRGLSESDYMQTKNWVLKKEWRKQSWKFWRDEFFVRRRGVDLGWVAGWLPELKKFSIDLTREAAEGHLPHIFGREKVLKQVLEVLARPKRNNVLLVGEAGVGKNSIVYAVTWLILGRRAGIDLSHLEDLIKPLEGRKVIELNVGGMVGASRGMVEGLFNEVMHELREGETVLYINQIENIIQAGLVGYLTPLLASTNFPIIATTTPKVYRENLENYAEFTSELEMVRIDPPSVTETIRILQGMTFDLEAKNKVFFTFPALHEAVEMSERYIHNAVLPAKAIKVMMKAIEIADTDLITKKDIARAVAELTRVPVGDLSDEESDKLLKLEELLQERIVGQEDGIREIARAIRRARTGVGSKERPIASLLFLGPTGVGKTLTAKTLAEVYFIPQSKVITSEVELNQLVADNFIRFDMSEFSEYGAVGTFLDRMTEEVKQKAFALILLDEFEKAEPNIHNLFLQIFEDGRLTNEDGETVDFRNTIIIATSNAIQSIESGLKKEEEMRDKLSDFFRPELINRFDGIVLFTHLDEPMMKKIVYLELDKLKQRLDQEYKIKLSWSQPLIEELARLGYDPEYGARPLRRLIQNRIEDALAQKLLRKELQQGDSYELTVRDLQ